MNILPTLTAKSKSAIVPFNIRGLPAQNSALQKHKLQKANDSIVLSSRAQESLNKTNEATKPQTPTFPDQKMLDKMASRHVDESFKRVPDSAGKDRHQRNALIQAQDVKPVKGKSKSYYNGAKVVIIAMEGTGSFDERRAPMMQDMGKELHRAGHDTQNEGFDPAALSSDALKTKRGKATNWSGLAEGTLTEIVKDPKLNENIQWLSFPSEETELLGSPDSYKNASVNEVIKDVALSTSGTSRGIEGAYDRITKIAAEAKAQGKNPKFVIMSHSSGGRSTVKLMERLKSARDPQTGKPFQIPLVMTVDPVKEAHEALKEGSREYINKGTEHNANKLRTAVGMKPKKVWPAAVGNEDQPNSLYKTSNVDNWINFYQTDDELGLKFGPKVGLRGSKIVGAENHRLPNQGESGHGEVNWDDDLLDRVSDELHSLIEQ